MSHKPLLSLLFSECMWVWKRVCVLFSILTTPPFSLVNGWVQWRKTLPNRFFLARYDESTSVRKELMVDGTVLKALQRIVPIAPSFDIAVWEMEKTAEIVEDYWKDSRGKLDPFGLVSWPGSVVAVQEMIRHPELVTGAHVLVLGCGVGIEALAAGTLGASSVLATDIHPSTFQLLNLSAQEADLENVISFKEFDIASMEALPSCDLVVVADVLYNDELAAHVARRCEEARSLTSPPVILISDSQRFVHNFAEDINERLSGLGQPGTAWAEQLLPSFTGSGVAIDDDQTYDVTARVMWISSRSSHVDRNGTKNMHFPQC